ncbi:MAG: VWA domain-containing protein, partial [Actinomycetales bacterium]
MRGSRYGRYTGGPDPLAAPVDAQAAIDELGRRMLSGESLREAMRGLMRDGLGDRSGLRSMASRIAQRRRELQQSGQLDGLLQDLRELIDAAIDAERSALFPDPSDDARFREAILDNVPPDVGRAVQELSTYDWTSPVARDLFDQVNERLRRDVVDQQFRSLSAGVQRMSDPAEQERMRQMMAELNQLLDRHRSGEATQEEYQEFIDRHRDFFPDAPDTLDEFIDELARQAAAMQRLLQSLDPQQRAELAAAMEQALADLGMRDQMDQLQQHLQALRPDFSWTGEQSMTGEQRLGLPDATRALADLADAESLQAQLADAMQAGDADLMDGIDEQALTRALGRGARDDLEAMRRMQQALTDEGYLTGDRQHLSPKAVRRIGRTALRTVFTSLDAGDRGDHQVRRTGAAGEPTGAHRAWAFGDEAPIDVVRTVQNAARRRAASGGDAAALHPDDFEVQQTETVTRAAIALLIDRSYSMAVNDTWGSAKTIALALHALTGTAYPLDALQVIAFANVAEVVRPVDLPALDVSYVQGTNLQHGLMLARRFLDGHPGAQRIVMVVTDGEPTAHLLGEGDWWFDWPPSQETITAT